MAPFMHVYVFAITHTLVHMFIFVSVYVAIENAYVLVKRGASSFVFMTAFVSSPI